MPRRVKGPDGIVRSFPDDATDAEISQALEPSHPAEPQKSFGGRMMDAAVDVPVGMVKNAGRMAQAIPGVAALTDKVYGLPEGSSKQSMQPTNDSQVAGGYLGDLALAVATGGAQVGGPIMGRAVGYISNPTVAERGMVAARDAADFGGSVFAAVKSQLASGPVTPEKVASLIVKYGKDVVKAGLIGAGGYGAWQTMKHLF